MARSDEAFPAPIRVERDNYRSSSIFPRGDFMPAIGRSRSRSEMGQSGKNSVRVYVFRCAHKLGHCLTELARRVCANNGHSGKPTKRLSLYVTSEQATRSSHSASSAITNEMFAKEPNDARVG